jgi:excisionase family DNA binding protein
MEARLHVPDLEEALLRAAMEGARLALEARPPPSPWLNVESAAIYLDTSREAIRGMVKRGQLLPHRSATGRLLFHRDELDAHARGEGT